jgi:HAD superfamily hydrolase (TIGR01490 family)
MTESTDSPSTTAAEPSNTVAFFDLDGTLVMGQTQLLLVKFMRRPGAIGWLFVAGTGLWFLGYKLGLVKLTRQIRERGATAFKGLTEALVEQRMIRFAEEILVPRLHPAALDELRKHKMQGDRVIILSAALEPVVKALCRRLGADECVGAECEVSQGRYTGRIRGAIPHANEKTRIAAGFMARWNATVADCWAYADHESDLNLMSWVGHPVAVNPRPAVLEVAQKRGWPILA